MARDMGINPSKIGKWDIRDFARTLISYMVASQDEDEPKGRITGTPPSKRGK